MQTFINIEEISDNKVIINCSEMIDFLIIFFFSRLLILKNFTDLNLLFNILQNFLTLLF